MANIKFSNNASTTLSGAINDTQTTITVTSASGFPALSAGQYFYATMYEISGATEINIEIIKVTATTGSTWTIERAADNTAARSRNGVTTCYVELRWTAASADAMLQASQNLSDLANAGTARTNLGLGSIATQDANNVNITGGTIGGVAITSLDSTTTIQDNADPTKQARFEASSIGTGTTRTFTFPNASGTFALVSDLTTGYQPLDSDLTAVAGLSASGIIARTGSGTMAVRALQQPAAGITVSNGDGVSGNPTLALANDLAAVEAISTTGFAKRTAADTWTATNIVDGDLPSALTGKTYNALTLTAAATGFSVAGGTTSKTLTVLNTITLAGTDGTTITLPATSGTLAFADQTFYIGTTQVAINRASASLSLTGVSIDGSAGSATTATTATKATNLAGGNATTLLGSIPYQSALDTTTLLAPNTTTNKRFLRMTGTGTNGAAPAWDSITASDVGLGSVENTALSTWAGSANLTTLGTIATGTWNATAIALNKGGTGATTKTAAFNALTPMTTLGDIEYHDGTDGLRLAGNTTTTRKFLRQTGTGTVSAAPSWDTLVDGDLPATLTGKTYNGLTLTAAATGFTVAGGTTSKTLTVSNTLTLAGTDGSTLNIGAGGTLGSAAFTASSAYSPVAGSASITTVGTISSGVWQGSAIGIGAGGTGQTTKTAAFDSLSPLTTLGDLIYHDGTDNVRLAGNTSTGRQFLTQTGTGTVSAAPGWAALVNADIPTTLTGKTYNGLTVTANATGFALSGGTSSKTLTISNSLTFSGTDGSSLAIGAGGTLGSAAFTASSAYEPAFVTLGVSKGGTGVATLTGLVKGNGTSAFSAAVAETDYVTPSGTGDLTNKTLVGVTVNGNMTFSGTGRRITGDFSNATTANKVIFQSSTTNGNTDLAVIPNGTSTRSSIGFLNSTDTVNHGYFAMLALSTDMRLWSGKAGTGTALPMTFYVDNAEAARFDTTGNLLGQDKLMTRMMLQDTGWDWFDQADTNTTGTATLNYTNGSHQRWAPTGTRTLATSNWPPSGNLGELLIEGVNLGAATITWPTINWIQPSGVTTTTIATYLSALSRTLQSSGTDWVLLWTRDAGTTIYGKLL